MNARTAGRPPHLGEGELLRLLDRDEGDAQMSHWEAHVSGCARCANQLEGLRNDATTVRDWLARASFEAELPPADASALSRSEDGIVALPSRPPLKRRQGPRPLPGWLRIAAVLVLLAAPLAAVPAVRTWLGATFGGAESPAVTPASVPTDAQTFSASPIRFAPAGGEFTVRFEAAQERGTLRIRRGEGGDARLEINGELPAGPVVSAVALSIRNASGSTASYALDVPARVTRVTVRIGERTVAVLDANAIGAGATLPLGAN